MAVEIFLVQLLCAFFSCAGRNPAPVPSGSVNHHHTITTAGFANSLDNLGPPVLKTANGWIQGCHMRTIRSRNIAAYMGIPYARPPVGELRFRAPVPLDPWEGYLRADVPGPVCLQVDATQFYNVMGQEDCLHLSVYTPRFGKSPADAPLPVIFYLHGGAYFYGSSDLWGPAYLLDHDVILVVPNFRQGVLGYLSTGDEQAPGNFGLKDQALALKWVSDNIAAFGGDPGRITVMGVDSGAAIANLNLISKTTQDYVSNAIFHSGSAHMHWSLVNRTYESSRELARSFGCNDDNTYSMVKCLREQNPHFVANGVQKVYKRHLFPWVNFGPVVEAPGPDAYLTETPFEAYAGNRVKAVPVLGGIVESEGDVFVHTLLKIIWKPDVLKNLNNHWFDVAPYLFDYYQTSLNPVEVSTKIREYYLKNVPINFDNRDRISRAIGDRFIVQGAHKGLQIHSRIAPTYAYFFDFPGNPSVTSTLKFSRNDWGVTHTDDLQYIFNSTLLFAPLAVGTPEYKISRFMTQAWVNFAYSGKPNVNHLKNIWTPISDPLNVQVLEINSLNRMIPFPYQERMDFWTSLKLQFDYSIFPVTPS